MLVFQPWAQSLFFHSAFLSSPGKYAGSHSSSRKQIGQAQTQLFTQWQATSAEYRHLGNSNRINRHAVCMQSARMARLITSGDGTLIQAEPSTSGELPAHIGPPNRQNSLEFLPVLPPMHIHSHPVTTGHGQFVSLLSPDDLYGQGTHNQERCKLLAEPSEP